MIKDEIRAEMLVEYAGQYGVTKYLGDEDTLYNTQAWHVLFARGMKACAVNMLKPVTILYRTEPIYSYTAGQVIESLKKELASLKEGPTGTQQILDAEAKADRLMDENAELKSKYKFLQEANSRTVTKRLDIERELDAAQEVIKERGQKMFELEETILKLNRRVIELKRDIIDNKEPKSGIQYKGPDLKTEINKIRAAAENINKMMF